MATITYNKHKYIGKWEIIDNSVWKYSFNYPQKNKTIVSFDLDDTLISTKSKKKYPISADDWIEINNSKNRLTETFKTNNIIIFSNQSKMKGQEELIKSKFEQVINYFQLPLTVYISGNYDHYRKPNIGMFQLMLKDFYNDNINEIETFIFIGDAAGRPKTRKHPKDFSCSDRKFCYNIGYFYDKDFEFKTPEEYFDNQKEEPFDWNEFDTSTIKFDKTVNFTPSKTQEIILFVGYPASGKSTFYETHLKPAGYAHVNQDELKTLAKCLSMTKKYIKEKKSICVDNTNPSKEIRQKYIQLSKDNNIPIRCIYFNVDLPTAKFLNSYRTNISNKNIPEISYNVYKKNFIEPSIEEGFSEVIKTDVILDSNLINEKYFNFKY